MAPSSGKKNKYGDILVVLQLIHRLMQADISCTTPARLFFFPTACKAHVYLLGPSYIL